MSKAVYLTAVLLLVASPFAAAEQSKAFGNYTVHYNALRTDNLTPSVAGLYNITRSKNRALINISVIKNEGDNTLIGDPVKANISGTVKNLSEQLRELNLKEISENNAIYYIAETPINNEEVLKFSLDITPEGADTTYNLSFQQQFFTE